ncbi:nucleotidyltransferase domain-containing protein [Metabacillus halosaccharovorans]|uniref:nucleotidyltransferase domain-containing protein n=1 Tax=Metabacillus halosaccharovorans TaxID=930124 RepID=UPI00203CC15B|nr:nucleotidyltransferase domain-containing protein [Metabacillus halosaccharovorans]MCM3443439.1 nucleotidyltransferase domain-containing protein [Metabacillus halosaccharovorans]
MQGEKLDPIEAANQFIDKYFSNCQGAILAGSVVRGEATETSDLDIVIFDKRLPSSYRESMFDFGWAIEIFVHNLSSYKYFIEMDCKAARPSMPRMISEGIIIKDEGILKSIKEEAEDILEKGPEKWSEEVIRTKRYFLTDALDDFLGSMNRAEEIFIANTIADLVHEFVLRTNRQWIGSSKWIIRALNQYDKKFTEEFVEAFNAFYLTGEKDKVVQLVDRVLKPHGGRLFEGFSLGK